MSTSQLSDAKRRLEHLRELCLEGAPIPDNDVRMGVEAALAAMEHPVACHVRELESLVRVTRNALADIAARLRERRLISEDPAVLHARETISDLLTLIHIFIEESTPP